MRSNRALACVIVVSLATNSSAEAAPIGSDPDRPLLPQMPADVVVEVPAGTFHVAPPPGLCAYPAAARDVFARSMPGYQIVLAGVWCGDITPAAMTEKRAARKSIVLAVQNEDALVKGRNSQPAFLKDCFLQFSPAKADTSLADAVSDFNGAGFKATIGSMGSLGVVGLLPGVVFGGSRSEMAAGGLSYVTTTVQACVVLSQIPVSWLFQAGPRSSSTKPFENSRVDELLSEAKAAVSASRERNVR